MKRNPALAVSEQLPESLSPPALDLEELLTAAHATLHGLKERVTPAHDPERLAAEVAVPMTAKTPDTKTATKSVMLRIANGCRADCAQVRRAREERKRVERKRESKRECKKKNSVRAAMHEAASKDDTSKAAMQR